MSSYTGAADRPDQAKAVAAVIAVHIALGLAILTGLNVRMVAHAVDELKTFDLRQPPPPPPPPPKPAPKPRLHKEAPGAPAKQAKPSPVVAPVQRIPAPSPIAAAKIAGPGAASTSGAAAAGSGTGVGRTGNGPGGGGTGATVTPPRLIAKIPNPEYRRLSATGLRRGNAGITMVVHTDGTVSDCRIVRTSGDPYIDQTVCQLAVEYIRFDPARDQYGRPVAQTITYFPNWWIR